MENIEKVVEQIVNWLRKCTEDAHSKGVVYGLSGGVDSAVIAALSKRAFGDNSLGIIMPIYSNKEDEEDALLVAKSLGIKYKKVVLDSSYDELLKSYDSKGDEEKLTLANLKPRLRMITLYYHAALYNYLVIGSSNRSELTVGYFTKYGDSGSDIIPLAPFVKHQVWEIAKYLGIPDKIINKAPTAGLWNNQTDEREMGISYDELDEYILTGRGEERVKNIVDSMYKKSQHKREYAKMFSLNL